MLIPCFQNELISVILLKFKEGHKSCFFFSFLTGIPSRKINNTTGPLTDIRTSQNESEMHGGGVQPTLAGTGEGTVRLGEESQL